MRAEREHGHEREPPIGRRGRIQPDRDRDLGTILSPGEQLEARALVSCLRRGQEFFDEARVLGAMALGDEGRQLLTQELLAVEAEA